MLSFTQEYLSKNMSKYLDELGFSHQGITERIRFNKKISKASVTVAKCLYENEMIEEIIAGSVGEGIGLQYCNDLDIVHVNHAVICSDNTVPGNDKLSFKIDLHRAPAGYTFLELMHKGRESATFESFEYAVVEKERGRYYLSSKLFMSREHDFLIENSFLNKITRYKKQHGPSNPRYFDHFFVEEDLPSNCNLTDKGIDFVRAFPCKLDNKILNAWKNRDRKCGWPGQETIADVMSLPVHVVPVGQKGIINEDLQWRISFTMAEKHLVQAFNNTHAKVFVLMKLIAKHILKPLCKGISSYVVKTLMLWLAEFIPQKEFCKENLLLRLMDALAILKIAIEDEDLPGYMLPQKNLLENKVTKKEQQLLLRKLTVLKAIGMIFVDEFFNDWCPYEFYGQIERNSLTFYNANRMNILTMLAFSCNTPEEIAGWFTKIHACKSLNYIIRYTHVFVLSSFYLKYGKKDRLFQKLNRKKGKRKKLQML